MRRRIHAYDTTGGSLSSFEEEHTCMATKHSSFEEEDTCMSYEEEDTCIRHQECVLIDRIECVLSHTQ
jgi:hypothetical protein